MEKTFIQNSVASVVYSFVIFFFFFVLSFLHSSSSYSIYITSMYECLDWSIMFNTILFLFSNSIFARVSCLFALRVFDIRNFICKSKRFNIVACGRQQEQGHSKEKKYFRFNFDLY